MESYRRPHNAIMAWPTGTVFVEVDLIALNHQLIKSNLLAVGRFVIMRIPYFWSNS